MGTKSHLEPQHFAEELREYLWAQIEPRGADRSGRWLESATRQSRSREYWRKITGGSQAMTANDIELVAAVLDQSPYEFIRAVRTWNTAGEPIEGRFRDQAEDLKEVAAESIKELHDDDTDDGYDA